MRVVALLMCLAGCAGPAAIAAGRACSTDYACNHGEHCLKDAQSLNGTCALAVNTFGSPAYSPPRARSFGAAAQIECHFLSDCPVGYQCGAGGDCVK